MRHPRRVCLFISFSIAVAWWPGAALGGEPSRLIHKWLTGLGQDDFATRQEATRRLLLEPLDLKGLHALYNAAQNPEQRNRLLTVARHHVLRLVRKDKFKDAGRGAIGIQHQSFAAGELSQLNQPGLLVVKTFPGFPGYTHLQAGDLIVGIDGQVFAKDLSAPMAANQFINEIQHRQAGGIVRLEVYRDGQKTSVSIQLASLSALQAMYRNAGQIQQSFLNAWVAQKQKIVSQHQGHDPVDFEKSQSDPPQRAQPQGH